MAPGYDIVVLNPQMAALRAAPGFQPVLVRSRAEFAAVLSELDEANARGKLPAYLAATLKDLRVKVGLAR